MTVSLPADRDDVRTLLEHCVAAWHEQGPRAADALLAAAPELAGPVREGLAALARAGLLDDEEPARLPDRIGAYRVRKLLGRGGMGAVFLAHDDTTDRDVAVKVVHPQLLWYGRARERFEREIRALARLSHRGAVPVFHFGEDGGVPFFVMEYIAGRSLAAILAAVAGRKPEQLTRADLDQAVAAAPGAPPSPVVAATPAAAEEPWWRAVVAIAIQVADTLHHVHQHGIVHRDVKPSNILVTPEGEARLVDFGLARIDGDAALTRVSTTIGSDPYMAPEQTGDRGGAADARSDVFSLGATLFEALSLRQPYGGGGPRTRQRILAGDHASLRTLQPQLPRDLEAVCSVAMAPEPQRRHATAAAFADDLRAVLSNRPVAARPIGTLARMWRLLRRHPLTTTALAATLLMSIAAPTWIAIQQYESSQAIGAALTRAERDREHALDAIDRLLARIAQNRLFELPEAEGVRRQLLQDAIEVQEAMLREAPQDPRLALETAIAKRRLAELHRWLGETSAADRCIEQALAILATSPPVSAIELARVLALRGRIASLNGDLQRAHQDHFDAVAALVAARSRIATVAGQLQLDRALAERRIDLAIAAGMLGDDVAAERGLAEALAALQRLPEDRSTLQTIGRALSTGVRAAVYKNDCELAARLATASVDAYRRAMALAPDDWVTAANCANVQTELCKLAYLRGHGAEALAVGQQAHDRLVQLQSQHSEVGWLTNHLAEAKQALADAFFLNQRRGDARRLLQEGVELLRALLRRDPASASLRSVLGRCLGMLADQSPTAAEAVELLAEAQQLFEALQREDPANHLSWRQLVVVYSSRAKIEQVADDLAGEAKWLDLAIAASRHLQAQGLPPARELLSATLLQRADCAARDGDAAAAHEFVREAMALVPLRRDQLEQRPGLAELLPSPAFAELFR